MWSKTPRRSWHSSMTVPTCSFGTITLALTYGSSTCSMRPESGICEGLRTSTISPAVVVTWYATFGAVASRSRSNSRSSRSWMISMCSRPRKPQRKPKPSAWLVSGS